MEKAPPIFQDDPLEIELHLYKISADGSRSISSHSTMFVFDDFDRAVRLTKLWSRVGVISIDIYEGDSDGKKEFWKSKTPDSRVRR